MKLFKNEVGRPSNETIKKRNIFKGLCLILFLMIIGLSAYILNDKCIIKIDNKKNSAEDKKITTTVKSDNNEEELVESGIEKLLVPFNTTSNDYYFWGYYYKEPKDLNNLDNDIIIFTSLVNTRYQTRDKIFSDTVNLYINSIFGNVQYEDKTVEGFCEQYIYDSSSKYYDFDGGCSSDSPKIISKIVDYEKSDEKLIIKNKILVEDFDFGSGIDTLYSDVNKKNIIDKIDTYKKEFDAEKEIDDYLDRLDTFKWTFTKHGENHYVFESVEKIN